MELDISRESLDGKYVRSKMDEESQYRGYGKRVLGQKQGDEETDRPKDYQYRTRIDTFQSWYEENNDIEGGKHDQFDRPGSQGKR